MKVGGEFMGFLQYLDISTIHVHPNDLKILEKNHKKLFSTFGKSEYGCIFSVGCGDYFEETLGDFRYLKLSELFIDVVKLAVKHDCMFINFDADGSKFPELQTSDQW
jgi:hypothetical protein